MSKRKDRERAEQYIIRNGVRIPRREWDKYQRELKELEEVKRLEKIGLVRGTARIVTPEEIMSARRPIKRRQNGKG